MNKVGLKLLKSGLGFLTLRQVRHEAGEMHAVSQFHLTYGKAHGEQSAAASLKTRRPVPSVLRSPIRR